MALQRRYGYVAIDSPLLEHDDWVNSHDLEAGLTVGLPQGDPWSAPAYGERSRTHIQVLMVVVLLLSAVAFWMVFRPNAAAFASGADITR